MHIDGAGRRLLKLIPHQSFHKLGCRPSSKTPSSLSSECVPRPSEERYEFHALGALISESA